MLTWATFSLPLTSFSFFLQPHSKLIEVCVHIMAIGLYFSTMDSGILWKIFQQQGSGREIGGRMVQDGSFLAHVGILALWASNEQTIVHRFFKKLLPGKT